MEQGEEDDFVFIPPEEIVSIERDTWYDRYQRNPQVAYYHVTYRAGGLMYSVHTWATDELDAYNRVMKGDVVVASPEPEEVE